MSADNYYLVRRHPNGGFVALMGFASDDVYDEVTGVQLVDGTPVVDVSRPAVIHETPEDALASVQYEWAEYGHGIHQECFDPVLDPSM